MADEKTTPEKEPDDGKKTPDEWARVFFPDGERGLQHRDAYKHGAAKALHGWDAYAYHHGQALRLDEAAYKGAIEAASKLVKVERDGGEIYDYKPHDAALPPKEGDAAPAPKNALVPPPVDEAAPHNAGYYESSRSLDADQKERA